MGTLREITHRHRLEKPSGTHVPARGGLEGGGTAPSLHCLAHCKTTSALGLANRQCQHPRG